MLLGLLVADSRPYCMYESDIRGRHCRVAEWPSDLLEAFLGPWWPGGGRGGKGGGRGGKGVQVHAWP